MCVCVCVCVCFDFAGGIIDLNASALSFSSDGTLWAGTQICATRISPHVIQTGTRTKTVWKFDRVGGLVENPGSVV